MQNKHLPKAIRVTAIIIIIFLLAMSAYTVYSYFFLKVQVSANVLAVRISSGTLTIVLLAIQFSANALGILMASAMLLKQKWAAAFSIVLLAMAILIDAIGIMINFDIFPLIGIFFRLIIIYFLSTNIEYLGLPECRYCKFPYKPEMYEKCPSCNKPSA